MSDSLAGYWGQTLVLGAMLWALVYVTLRAVEYGAVALLAWKQRRADDARYQAWCAERDRLFDARHPVLSDDAEQTDAA